MGTDCTTKSISLSSLRRQKLLLEFDGGRITSDAGALLLREADRRLKLVRRISGCIPDPRDPDLIEHHQRTLLSQRVMGIACGWEDLNDHQTLRDDPLWQILTNRGVDAQKPLASPSTLCRLENRVSRKTCARLSSLMVDLFIESYREQPKELILDFDATNDPVHGHQEGRFFHGYYDEYCFLPLYVFCGSRLLCAYLRPSDRGASHHAWAILSLLVKRIRQAWPQVRIIFRGDSGFCRWRMMRWCDRHRVDYILGLARNPVLEKIASPLMQEAQRQHEQMGVKQRFFAWSEYGAETWDCKRRVIMKAEHTDEGPNPRFVVTNLPGDAQGLYDHLYCARGQAENYIKEQQLGLFADRTSCHDFKANQFRVLLSGFAYILIDHLRRTVLGGTELATAQVDTIRLKLFKIGAVVKTSVRRLVLHLSSAYPLQALFKLVCQRLGGLEIVPVGKQMSG